MEEEMNSFRVRMRIVYALIHESPSRSIIPFVSLSTLTHPFVIISSPSYPISKPNDHITPLMSWSPTFHHNHQITPTETANNPIPIPKASLPPLPVLGIKFLLPAEAFDEELGLEVSPAAVPLPETVAVAEL